MRAFAAIDRIEGDYAVCEVIDCEETVELGMCDISLKVLSVLVGSVEEGDVLVVEYYDGKIVWVYYNDDYEKQRRINLLKEIMEK